MLSVLQKNPDITPLASPGLSVQPQTRTSYQATPHFKDYNSKAAATKEKPSAQRHWRLLMSNTIINIREGNSLPFHEYIHFHQPIVNLVWCNFFQLSQKVCKLSRKKQKKKNSAMGKVKINLEWSTVSLGDCNAQCFLRFLCLESNGTAQKSLCENIELINACVNNARTLSYVM